MTRESFRALLVDALLERDRQRRARLMDQANYEAADAAFVAKILEAAGYPVAAEAEAIATKARRSRRKNESSAFGDDGT